MRKFQTIVFIVACLFLFSCRKKTEDGSNNSNPLLVKTLTKWGVGDSAEVTFSYDASQRLIEEKVSDRRVPLNLGI